MKSSKTTTTVTGGTCIVSYNPSQDAVSLNGSTKINGFDNNILLVLSRVESIQLIADIMIKVKPSNDEIKSINEQLK